MMQAGSRETLSGRTLKLDLGKAQDDPELTGPGGGGITLVGGLLSPHLPEPLPNSQQSSARRRRCRSTSSDSVAKVHRLDFFACRQLLRVSIPPPWGSRASVRILSHLELRRAATRVKQKADSRL